MNVSPRPNRQLRAGTMAMALFALAACATTPTDTAGTPPTARDELPDEMRNDPVFALLKRLPEGESVAPPARDFIGRPVAALETYTGAPALTRVEGTNEFRRYDLGPCRAYAIVAPRGGNVVSLTVGPAVSGRTAPAFPDCFVPATSVGT